MCLAVRLGFAFILLASGCGRAPVPLPVVGHGDGQVEWRGSAPCADCERIDIRLMLQRRGEARNYLVVEQYVVAGTGARFVDRGQWRQDAALLRLAGDAGSRRTYAVLDDGRLQARDSHGRPLPVRDDALLSPVTP